MRKFKILVARVVMFLSRIVDDWVEWVGREEIRRCEVCERWEYDVLHSDHYHDDGCCMITCRKCENEVKEKFLSGDTLMFGTENSG